MTCLTNKNLISLNLEASSKEEAIRKLAEKMDVTDCLHDMELYIADVLKREAQASTGIGFHVAIPHAKSAGVKNCSVAFGKLSKPMDWESMDGEDVKVIFLIAVPEGGENQHLKILSTLSRKLIHEEFRNKLFDGDELAVIKFLEETLTIQ